MLFFDLTAFPASSSDSMKGMGTNSRFVPCRSHIERAALDGFDFSLILSIGIGIGLLVQSLTLILIFKQTDVAWRDDECVTIFKDDFGAVTMDYDSSPKHHYGLTNSSRSDFEVDVVLVDGYPRHSDQ